MNDCDYYISMEAKEFSSEVVERSSDNYDPYRYVEDSMEPLCVPENIVIEFNWDEEG